MSKGQTYLLSLSVLLIFLLSGSVLSHGGGLDAQGCHHDRKRGGYHCHRSPAVQQSPSQIERLGQDPQQSITPTSEPIAVPSLMNVSTSQTVAQCAALVKQQNHQEMIDHIFERRGNRITMEVDGTLQETIGKPSPDFITARSLCADLAALSLSPATYQKEIEQRIQAKKQLEKQRKEQATDDAVVQDWQERARQVQEREVRETQMAARQREAAERARVEQSRSPKEKQALKDKDCRPNLQCWGNKQNSAAIFSCQDHIEKLAKHQAEWTDGWLEPKFSHFRWKDETRGIVTYIGDRIKFHNGFGAWTFYTYECDYDTKHEIALAVRAQLGRLP